MSDEPRKHHLLCIVCPEGCEMDVVERDGDLVFPKGICRRGRDYARREIYDPCRVLTTTVPVEGGEIAMLPVRTDKPVPKPKLIAVMREIASIAATAPIAVGDVIREDVMGTGAALIACRAIAARQHSVSHL